MILVLKSVPASNVFYRPKDQNGSPALPIHYNRVTWDQYFNILRLSISILILKHEKGTQKFILDTRTGVWRSWKISMRPLVTNICLAVISMSNCYRYFWCLRIKNVTGIGVVRYVRHGTFPVIWYLNVLSSPSVGGQKQTCEPSCPVLLIQSEKR